MNDYVIHEPKTRSTPRSAGRKTTLHKDLCGNSFLTAKVDQFLAHLDDSSSEESEDDGNPKKKTTRGRRHTLKSGKASKLTSQRVNQQLWPHSYLSLSYVSRDKKYDELTLAEFAAQYAAILQRPNLTTSLTTTGTSRTYCASFFFNLLGHTVYLVFGP